MVFLLVTLSKDSLSLPFILAIDLLSETNLHSDKELEDFEIL